MASKLRFMEKEMLYQSHGRWLWLMRLMPSHTIHILGGVVMPPHERDWTNNYLAGGYKENNTVASRGTSKSFVHGSMAAELDTLLHKGLDTLVVSASGFRGGKLLFEDGKRLIIGELRSQKLPAPFLKNSLDNPKVIRQEPDRWIIKWRSHSQLMTLPSNNPDAMRGIRARKAVIDERNTFDGDVVQVVIRPMLNVGGDFDKIASAESGNAIYQISTIDYTFRDYWKEIDTMRRTAKREYDAMQSMRHKDWAYFDRLMTENKHELQTASIRYSRYDYTDLLIPEFLTDPEDDVTYQVNYPLRKGLVKKDLMKWDDRDSCTPADAPIMMADWTSKPISEVRRGDVIIGVDLDGHTRQNKGIRSQIVETKVLMAGVVRTEKIVKVTFASGRVLRCTADHRWLARTSRITRRDGSKELPYLPPKVGREVAFLADAHIPPVTPQANTQWLAGIFDGEGSVSNQKKGSGFLNIAQSQAANPEIVNEIKNQLALLGLKAAYDGRQFVFGCNKEDRRKFYLWCKCVKSERIRRSLFHASFTQSDKIISVEDDGEEPVYALQTETGNYICYGYISRNCNYWYTYPVDKQSLEEPLLNGTMDEDLWLAEQRNVFIEASGAVYPDSLIKKASEMAIYSPGEIPGFQDWTEEFFPPVLYTCGDVCVVGIDYAREKDDFAIVVIRLGPLSQGKFNPEGWKDEKGRICFGETPWSSVIWAESWPHTMASTAADKIRELRERFNIINMTSVNNGCGGIGMDFRGGGSAVRDELANPKPPVMQNGQPDPSWKEPIKIYDPTDESYEHYAAFDDKAKYWSGLRLLTPQNSENWEWTRYTKAGMEQSGLYIGYWEAPSTWSAKKDINTTTGQRDQNSDEYMKWIVGYNAIKKFKNQLVRLQVEMTPSGLMRVMMPGKKGTEEGKKDLYSAFIYGWHIAREHLVNATKDNYEAPNVEPVIVNPGGVQGGRFTDVHWGFNNTGGYNG